MVAICRTPLFTAVCTGKALVANTLSLLALAMALAVVGAGELTAVFARETFLTVTGAVDTAAAVEAVIGADELTAVLTCEALITHALVLYAPPTVVAVVEAQGLIAIITSKAILAHTLAIHTHPMFLTAGHRADFEATVNAGIAFKAHTDSVHTPALVVAVIGTGQLAAVLTRETLVTDTLSVKALASEVTVSGTFGLRAVGAFPAWFTDTATSFGAEVASATAEGPRVQTAFCRLETTACTHGALLP